MQWSHLPESLPANSLYPLPQCGHCLQIKSYELQTCTGINKGNMHESKHTLKKFKKYWPTCNCHSLSETKSDLLWITLNSLELHALGVPIYLGQEHGLPRKSIQSTTLHLQVEICWTKSCSCFKGMPMSNFNPKLVMSSKIVRAMQCILGIPLRSDFYSYWM